MRKNTIVTIALVCLIALASCTGTKHDPDTYRKGWELTWEDEFDNASSMSSWIKMGRGKTNINRYMSDNEALYVLEDGLLVLRGVENAGDKGQIPFLTGGVFREAQKKNSVSRIEVRARMNLAEGAVPFISLVPSDDTPNIAVDLMERYGFDEFIYQSVTSEYTTTHGMPDNPPSSTLVGVDPSQFHIYGVETYADSVVFYVDNNRTKKYPRVLTEITGQFPFNEFDMDLCLGVRLNNDADIEMLPVDLFVDWVRYYEPATAVAP